MQFTKTTNEFGQTIRVADTEAGRFTIDGNNATRNRWTVTYPDGDYGMVDTMREAIAWAELWLAAQPRVETVTASNGETFTTGDRAYVAGYQGPDIPVRVVGAGTDPDTVRVSFSKHDHGRNIARGSVEDVSTFFMLPAELVERVGA